MNKLAEREGIYISQLPESTSLTDNMLFATDNGADNNSVSAAKLAEYVNKKIDVAGQVNNGVSEANSYTDTKKTEAVSEANGYADTKKTEAVSESKTYTDSNISGALRPQKTQTFNFTTSDEAGWYKLVNFPSQASNALIKLQATGYWEETLWIFVGSNYFSGVSPTINIIGNTFNTRISKFRCNCSTSGNSGSFSLDAYIAPTQSNHKLTIALYDISSDSITIPTEKTISETATERAVTAHSAPCGIETSAIKTYALTLLNGWVAGDDGGAKIIKSGRMCFMNIKIKGGTVSGGTIIFNLPEETYPPINIPVTCMSKYKTGANTYAVDLRTDIGNICKFSAVSQPSYTTTDELILTAVWEAKY